MIEKFYAYSSLIHHTINGRSFVLPQSNFFQGNYSDYITPCKTEECENKACTCTFVEKLPMHVSGAK